MLRCDGCCIALLDVEDDRPVSDGSSPRYGIVCREGCVCVRAVAAEAVVNLSVSTVC